MRKLLCACGCGSRVTRKVEWQHMKALGPTLLASQVLVQNPTLIRHKKRSHPTPFHPQLTMHNTSEINDNFYMDHAGPSGHTNNLDSSTMMGENLDDEVSEVDDGGPSVLNNDDVVMGDNLDEVLTNDDALMGENPDGEVYGLSKLRRSERIANHAEKISQQQWQSNDIVHFVHDKELEESDEEEEDIEFEDEEPVSDLDVDSDEGLEGDDDEDKLIAGQGQEGISVWDILGEGFLKEASQLGMLFCYYFLNSF